MILCPLLSVPHTCQGLWTLTRAILEWPGTWLWDHFLGLFFTHPVSAIVRMELRAYPACVSMALASSGIFSFFHSQNGLEQGQGSVSRLMSMVHFLKAHSLAWARHMLVFWRTPLADCSLAVRPTSGLDHSPTPTNTHQTLLKHSSVSICADDCLLGQRPLSGASEVQQINK